jgi:spore coat polysaccharide biosynthesis protein SpsF
LQIQGASLKQKNMSDTFKTTQEEFWSGEFGDAYINRNKSDQLLASNIHYWSEILKHAQSIKSVLELGANVGMNIKALKLLLPSATFAGVEINKAAYESLITINGVDGYHESIFDFEPKQLYDFVFIKGVLIHINPDMLKVAYDKLYNSSSKYICIGEYYNPTPVALSYRGHNDKLFKRDFAGEFKQQFPDVELVKYGFSYRGDNVFPQDDITWFLFKKAN